MRRSRIRFNVPGPVNATVRRSRLEWCSRRTEPDGTQVVSARLEPRLHAAHPGDETDGKIVPIDLLADPEHLGRLDLMVLDR